MSTLDPKPNKVRTLNTKLLPIAAILLMVLALLFMATPLLRVSEATVRTGFNRQFTGQNSPDGTNGFSNPGTGMQGQGFIVPNDGTQSPGITNRTFAGRGGGLLGFGLLSGIAGTIVYAMALLISLTAAVGMFITRRWGQVLGIVMAVIYLLLGLVSFLPMILMAFMRGLNGLSLGLSILHLVLALAVIVLASIPAKKKLTPAPEVATVTPPADRQ